MTRIVTPEVPASVAVLTAAARVGALRAHEVQLCAAVRRLQPACTDDDVRALALTSRAVRLGHSCIDLAGPVQVVDADGAPISGLLPDDLSAWRTALETSALVRRASQPSDPSRPLVLDGDRLYLDRWWHHEREVAATIVRRATAAGAAPAPDLGTVLDSLFGPDDLDEPDLQRRAASAICTQALAIVAGGPGTGKTRTVARSLVAIGVLAERSGATLPEVVLCAPTGKAAQRMSDAIQTEAAATASTGVASAEVVEWLHGLAARTIHSVLGAHPMRGFARNRRSPVRADLVVVDEMSMVSLSLFAHLLDALTDSTRLVLVGDPHQLVSIDTGSVAADLVEAAADPATTLAPVTTVLQRVRRFGADSAISALADAIRAGDADAVIDVLAAGEPELEWVLPTDDEQVAAVRAEVVADALASADAAVQGDGEGAVAAAQRTKVLAALRAHEFGVDDWNARVGATLATTHPGAARLRWWPGRPILVTENDAVNRVHNGDIGVVVADPEGPRVALADGASIRMIAPARLGAIETWWAMTIHKSQGSEFDHVVVSLPGFPTPILTRELLYTAVTRARRRLTVVGDEATIRVAVETRVVRASGLPSRLGA